MVDVALPARVRQHLPSLVSCYVWLPNPYIVTILGDCTTDIDSVHLALVAQNYHSVSNSTWPYLVEKRSYILVGVMCWCSGLILTDFCRRNFSRIADKTWNAQNFHPWKKSTIRYLAGAIISLYIVHMVLAEAIWECWGEDLGMRLSQWDQVKGHLHTLCSFTEVHH